MSAQVSSGLILLAIAFLLPGLIVAVGIAFFMRRYNRFRSWIRITLILTALGTAMWVVTVKFLGVNVGGLQVGSMASVVALFSSVLALIAVWIVPRKVAHTEIAQNKDDHRPIKIRNID